MVIDHLTVSGNQPRVSREGGAAEKLAPFAVYPIQSYVSEEATVATMCITGGNYPMYFAASSGYYSFGAATSIGRPYAPPPVDAQSPRALFKQSSSEDMNWRTYIDPSWTEPTYDIPKKNPTGYRARQRKGRAAKQGEHARNVRPK